MPKTSAQKRLHGGPGFLVGLLVVGRALGVVGSCIPVGERMNGTGVGDEFVFHAAGLHFLLEGGDFGGWHEWIVSAMEHQDAALDVLRVGRASGVPSPPWKETTPSTGAPLRASSSAPVPPKQ